MPKNNYLCKQDYMKEKYQVLKDDKSDSHEKQKPAIFVISHIEIKKKFWIMPKILIEL